MSKDWTLEDKLGTYYCADIVKELFRDWIDGGMKE